MRHKGIKRGSLITFCGFLIAGSMVLMSFESRNYFFDLFAKLGFLVFFFGMIVSVYDFLKSK